MWGWNKLALGKSHSLSKEPKCYFSNFLLTWISNLNLKYLPIRTMFQKVVNLTSTVLFRIVYIHACNSLHRACGRGGGQRKRENLPMPPLPQNKNHWKEKLYTENSYSDLLDEEIKVQTTYFSNKYSPYNDNNGK